MTSTFSADVEYWPLDRLIPHVRNARTHSEAQVAQIAGSIAEFGFVNPVLVGDDGVIVAGHGRVLAARKLGLSEAPVIVLAHLSPTQRRALMIADERTDEDEQCTTLFRRVAHSARQTGYRMFPQGSYFLFGILSRAALYACSEAASFFFCSALCCSDPECLAPLPLPWE